MNLSEYQINFHTFGRWRPDLCVFEPGGATPESEGCQPVGKIEHLLALHHQALHHPSKMGASGSQDPREVWQEPNHTETASAQVSRMGFGVRKLGSAVIVVGTRYLAKTDAAGLNQPFPSFVHHRR